MTKLFLPIGRDLCCRQGADLGVSARRDRVFAVTRPPSTSPDYADVTQANPLTANDFGLDIGI